MKKLLIRRPDGQEEAMSVVKEWDETPPPQNHSKLSGSILFVGVVIFVGFAMQGSPQSRKPGKDIPMPVANPVEPAQGAGAAQIPLETGQGLDEGDADNLERRMDLKQYARMLSVLPLQYTDAFRNHLRNIAEPILSPDGKTPPRARYAVVTKQNIEELRNLLPKDAPHEAWFQLHLLSMSGRMDSVGTSMTATEWDEMRNSLDRLPPELRFVVSFAESYQNDTRVAVGPECISNALESLVELAKARHSPPRVPADIPLPRVPYDSEDDPRTVSPAEVSPSAR